MFSGHSNAPDCLEGCETCIAVTDFECVLHAAPVPESHVIGDRMSLMLLMSRMIEVREFGLL